MATVSPDPSAIYLGYERGDLTSIGAGILNPNIYATPEYAKKKVDSIPPSGGLFTGIYAGFSTDPNPSIISIKQEFQFNTILGINIRYMDSSTRKMMFKLILDSNSARIESQSSLIVDWHMLARQMPTVIPYVTRRYKLSLLRINDRTDKGLVPLVEWPNMVDIDSPFDGFYKERKTS